MKAHKLSPEYLKRITDFKYKSTHSKDVLEGSEILEHLPESLNKEITLQLDEASAYPVNP
jgi:hypothetical protein